MVVNRPLSFLEIYRGIAFTTMAIIGVLIAGIAVLGLSMFRRFFYCILLICLLGLSLHPAIALADAPPLSLEDYWALIQETRQTLATLSGSEAVQHTQLAALAERWEQARRVRLDDGTLLNLDNSFWLDQLRSEKPDPARLSDSLDALINAHQMPGRTPPLLDTNSLHQILSRPEFQWQSAQQSNWLSDILNRFLKWLSSLLGSPVSISAPNSQTLQFLGICAAIVIGLLLAYILRGLFTNLAADADLNTENGVNDEPLSADMAFERAENLSGQGDYRSAVRYLYLSALLLLDERGLLVYDRTRTNREYLRDLNSLPQIAVLLHSVIDVFDRVWYGFQPLDAETYQLYTEQVTRLKEQK